MSGGTFQSEFNTWTAAPFNYRLTRISGSEASGAATYTAIFEQSEKKSGWVAQAGMTEAAFTTYHNQVAAQGYRLIWLDGYAVGSTDYYNGIWEANGGAEQRISLGHPLTTQQVADSVNQAAGYVLSDACSFSVSGDPLYCGVWNKSSRPDATAQYGLTAAAYQTAFNTMSGNGYSLWRVTGADSSGTALFTGVWRKSSPGPGWSIHGMSASSFEAQNTNAQYEGYRPFIIDPYVVGATPYYNATWVRNGGFDSTRLDTIATAVQNYMSSHNLPGLSLAIAHQGHIVYARGFGYANTATGEPAHALHRWRIASSSKIICAVSALRALEDSSAWSLDSKCFGSGALFGTDYGNTSTYPYNANEKGITIRHLMTMTAGWNSEGNLWYGDAPAYGTDHAQIIDYQLNSVNPNWAPNTRYYYNNFNYQVVARIPEKITGMSFLNYTQQQVFGPCGMTSMALGGRTAADRLPNEVANYAGDVFGSPETVWPARMDGSTGWVCRPMDLLLLGRRIDGNPRQADIIGSYALSQMQLGSGVTDSNGNPSSYGLAWYPSYRNSKVWWQHNGSMAGTKAILCVSDDGDESFAYATNSVDTADEYSGTIRDLVIDQLKSIDAAATWPDIDLSGKYNTTYDNWATSAFGSAATARTSLAEAWGPDGDPDGDGRPNVLEAYLGTSPTTADADAPWLSSYVTSTNLVLHWLKKNGSRGVNVIPEASSDLVHWSPNGPSAIVSPPGSIVPIGSTAQEVSLPRGNALHYLRLRFETN
jgi:CubicO group peptidase (beta-lactamase class C family)